MRVGCGGIPWGACVVEIGLLHHYQADLLAERVHGLHDVAHIASFEAAWENCMQVLPESVATAKTSAAAGHPDRLLVEEVQVGGHVLALMRRKRISEQLGVSAYEVYQVELPPGAETVRHDHLDDRVEDVYAILRGEGWVIVDHEPVPVEPGQFIAVTLESARQVRAGETGLVFIALCAAPR